MRCASLPWYDLDEIRWATDLFWREMAERLVRFGVRNVPARLNRDIHYEQQWSSSDFLFGQACGYDVCATHASRLQVVATPCYSAPGCHGPTYSSFVVVRDGSRFGHLEDLRGTRCVINTPSSHSGMNVLRALVAPLHENGRFFADVQVSGSHATSLRLIQRGDVDVAAIDCVTHALLARHRPNELSGTRVLMQTRQEPAPPFVTGASTSSSTLIRLRQALDETLAASKMTKATDALCIDRVEVLPFDAYESIDELDDLAHEHDYHEMHGDSLGWVI